MALKPEATTIHAKLRDPAKPAEWQAVRGFNGASETTYFLPAELSSFDAILTRSASDSACIFRITWPR
jgi:hypothetical protein